MESKKADLHLHTSMSDGLLSPQELILKIKDAGITIFSVTDHDTVAALDEMKRRSEFLGLTAAQRQLLERDGDRHSGEILYRFNIAPKHFLTPAFIYTYNDRDGDAMKNDAYDFQLTYAYFGDPITLTANALIGWADYDDENPIYSKTQDDDRYGIQGTVYYKNPWGWSLFGSNPMSFYIGAAFAKTNANIDFYDQQAIMTTAGVFFKW